MPLRALFVVALHLLIAGCDERPDQRSGADRYGISAVSPDDREMNAAIAEARARMPELLTALKQRSGAVTRFSVKARYATRSGEEHIWIGDISYDGTSFAGRVENVPRDIEKLKYGDTVRIAPSQISDWLYVEDGRLVGAFTMRVIYRRMPPAQQQAFRQQLGHRLDW